MLEPPEVVLVRTGFSTRSIAHMLGYGSVPMLCREFKKFYGMTITQCRGNRKRKLGRAELLPPALE